MKCSRYFHNRYALNLLYILLNYTFLYEASFVIIKIKLLKPIKKTCISNYYPFEDERLAAIFKFSINSTLLEKRLCSTNEKKKGRKKETRPLSCA